MNNQNNISNYFSMRIHPGKDGIYGILRLENVRSMTNDTESCLLKEEFKKYFSEGSYKKLGVTKHALDMSKIPLINNNGLAAVLVYNRQSNNRGEGYISLIGCDEEVLRSIAIAQLDSVFNIRDTESDL